MMLINCLVCFFILFVMTSLRVLVCSDTLKKEMGVLSSLKSMNGKSITAPVKGSKQRVAYS